MNRRTHSLVQQSYHPGTTYRRSLLVRWPVCQQREGGRSGGSIKANQRVQTELANSKSLGLVEPFIRIWDSPLGVFIPSVESTHFVGYECQGF